MYSCDVTKFGKNRSLGSCQNVLVTKNLAARKTTEPLILPHLANRFQNCLNVVAPWLVHVLQIGLAADRFYRSYSRKIDFSDRQSDYNMMQLELRLILSNLFNESFHHTPNCQREKYSTIVLHVDLQEIIALCLTTFVAISQSER